VDFGFRDAEQITGDLSFPSILKYHAANELAELFDLLGDKKKAERYRLIGGRIKKALPHIFADERGMLRASTGKSHQADVWGTALAVYFGVLGGKDLEAACKALADAYKKGVMAYKGNIRHVFTTDDFSDSTAWEVSGSAKNTYQNGAYWGTPTGWVCYAIAKVDRPSARKLAAEYIRDLRETDFRKGKDFGGPYECFYPPAYKQNPVYLATVSCPYGVFRVMAAR
jgi:GH15 family glucan-1,4-alpha-glucosidase